MLRVTKNRGSMEKRGGNESGQENRALISLKDYPSQRIFSLRGLKNFPSLFKLHGESPEQSWRAACAPEALGTHPQPHLHPSVNRLPMGQLGRDETFKYHSPTPPQFSKVLKLVLFPL